MCDSLMRAVSSLVLVFVGFFTPNFTVKSSREANQSKSQHPNSLFLMLSGRLFKSPFSYKDFILLSIRVDSRGRFYCAGRPDFLSTLRDKNIS